jgi:hypothetical protein
LTENLVDRQNFSKLSRGAQSLPRLGLFRQCRNNLALLSVNQQNTNLPTNLTGGTMRSQSKAIELFLALGLATTMVACGGGAAPDGVEGGESVESPSTEQSSPAASPSPATEEGGEGGEGGEG